jgi:hypothetical protein
MVTQCGSCIKVFLNSKGTVKGQKLINIYINKKTNEKLNQIHIIDMKTFPHRESVLKVDHVFAENVHKSAQLICSNGAPN